MPKEPEITVLFVEPGKIAGKKVLKNDLKSFQEAVGGLIQCTYPYPDDVGLVCNDEGKLLRLQLNRALKMPDSDEIYDIVAGNFFIAGLDNEGNFRSLTNEEFRKFQNMFRLPELFFRDDKKIVAIPDVLTTEEFIDMMKDDVINFLNGPAYRGAPYPEYDPLKINEAKFQDEWRAKEVKFQKGIEKDGSVSLCISWCSQGVGTDNGKSFFTEVCRMVAENAKIYLGNGSKLKVKIALFDRDGLFKNTFDARGMMWDIGLIFNKVETEKSLDDIPDPGRD